MKHIHSYTHAQWNALPLRERLEILRKHYCTGPRVWKQDISTKTERDYTEETIDGVLDVLDALIRFHDKVACPGPEDCYACKAIDVLNWSGGEDVLLEVANRA